MNLRAQGEKGGGIVRRRRGVANIADHRAHVADLNIGRPAGGLSHGRIVFQNIGMRGHIGQKGGGPYGQALLRVESDVVQLRYPFNGNYGAGL